MTNIIDGEVTAETILSQCMRMSNDSIHAFFNYSPHLDEVNQIQVIVKFNDKQIYNSYEHYGSSLAETLQDLIAISYEQEAKQEGMQNEV